MSTGIYQASAEEIEAKVLRQIKQEQNLILLMDEWGWVEDV